MRSLLLKQISGLSRSSRHQPTARSHPYGIVQPIKRSMKGILIESDKFTWRERWREKGKGERFFPEGRRELYARENYEKCLDHLKNGTAFENTNLPPGHVFKPWNLESELKRMESGRRSSLKENGDWSP